MVCNMIVPLIYGTNHVAKNVLICAILSQKGENHIVFAQISSFLPYPFAYIRIFHYLCSPKQNTNIYETYSISNDGNGGHTVGCLRK